MTPKYQLVTSLDDVTASKGGWTYLLISSCGRYLKIGHSLDNIEERILYAHTMYPYKHLDFEFYFAINNSKYEDQLHEYFREYRAKYVYKQCYSGNPDHYLTAFEARNRLQESGKAKTSDLFYNTRTELFRFPIPVAKKQTLKTISKML